MKVEFWKESGQLFIAIPCFTVCSIALIVTGAITTLIPMLIIGCIFLLFTLYILFAPNYALTKVIFSEDGVEIKWFKKQIAFIRWDEIIEAKATSRGKAAYGFLSFFTNTKEIEIQPRKKIYKSIMELCTNLNIKNQIKNDIHLKCFNREK